MSTSPAETDTIVAVATPPGAGGVGIVRVSGPGTTALGRAILGTLPRPRYATLCAFREADGAVLDQGLALWFPAPRSFTGEDVLELHGHGGPVVLDLLVRRCLELGARPARPGEFSERAFLNGKLDLAQAEAVADLIDSGSEAAARSALRSLQGVFSRRVHALVELLVELRTCVEAAMDFPEEEIDFLSEGDVGARLAAVAGDLEALRASARQGRLLREGMTLVLAGRPNAGKSSLLNALSQQDSAIVSPVPGTTRDVLREHIQLDGLPVHVLDTAGLRETGDLIETEGVRRARAAMEQADRILLIVDDRQTGGAELPALLQHLPGDRPYTIVRNKIDLSGRPPGLTEESGRPCVAVSMKTGAGMAALREHLKQSMGYHVPEAGGFMARRRHLEALDRAAAALDRAREQLQTARAGELVAEELRQAQQALGEITGEFTSEDLLGRIFSGFCIGK